MRGSFLGVNLRGIFDSHPVPDGWYAGKRIAVDGHNVAFRYLTSMRSPDGDVLRNEDGRVVAHLYGFLGLVRHLRERGAEPIVVWDGDVHPRKRATVDVRIQKRLEAALNAQDALAAGDHAAHQKYMRATTFIDRRMVEDCTQLLQSVGVAVVRADHDAERYAAALARAGYADAVATEDYDALVAGAPVVLRKAGSPDAFLHLLSDLEAHGLSAQQLRWMAIFCGTDWHPGVDGFGVKTVLKMLKDHPDVRTLVAEAGAGTSRYHRMVREAGLTPRQFDELDAFIAEVPRPAAPKAPQPNPEHAAELADSLHLGRARALSCFC
jgi:flap endonuclease-1